MKALTDLLRSAILIHLCILGITHGYNHVSSTKAPKHNGLIWMGYGSGTPSYTSIPPVHRHRLRSVEGNGGNSKHRTFHDRLKFSNRLPFRLMSSSSPSVHPHDQTKEAKNWASYAMLISSFSDGIEQSNEAQEFLKYSLVCSLLRHFLSLTESDLKESVLVSPCQGPDVDVLALLEETDLLLETGTASGSGSTDMEGSTRRERTDRMLQYLTSKGRDLELRIVYVPTAMYALRSDSSSTPGKQRQRARADGKKRRNQLISMVESFFADTVNIRAVTLDLDDSSIKQPYASSPDTNTAIDPSSSTSPNPPLPTDGIEALTDWKPHLLYLEGGNTFWLQHCIDKGSWSEHLLGACRVGVDCPAVYMGKSAGAIVAGRWMETASWKEMDDPSVVPGREQYKDWKGTNGMNLAGDSSIFPHMKPSWKPTVDEKRLDLQPKERGEEQASSDGTSSKLYCLTDFDVCCVEGATKDCFIVKGRETI